MLPIGNANGGANANVNGGANENQIQWWFCPGSCYLGNRDIDFKKAHKAVQISAEDADQVETLVLHIENGNIKVRKQPETLQPMFTEMIGEKVKESCIMMAKEIVRCKKIYQKRYQ